jgi:type VI protein secretion system component VasK
MAVATFEDRSGSWPGQRFDGPWAWFRLLDAAQGQREPPQRTILNFSQGSYRTRVSVEGSSRNPFANREWQRFACRPIRAST